MVEDYWSLVSIVKALFLKAITGSHSSTLNSLFQDQFFLWVGSQIGLFYLFWWFWFRSSCPSRNLSICYISVILIASFSLNDFVSRKECLFLTWLSLMESLRRLQNSIIIYSLTRLVLLQVFKFQFVFEIIFISYKLKFCSRCHRYNLLPLNRNGIALVFCKNFLCSRLCLLHNFLEVLF